jgi:hypothetical protein
MPLHGSIFGVPAWLPLLRLVITTARINAGYTRSGSNAADNLTCLRSYSTQSSLMLCFEALRWDYGVSTHE